MTSNELDKNFFGLNELFTQARHQLSVRDLRDRLSTMDIDDIYTEFLEPTFNRKTGVLRGARFTREARSMRKDPSKALALLERVMDVQYSGVNPDYAPNAAKFLIRHLENQQVIGPLASETLMGIVHGAPYDSARMRYMFDQLIGRRELGLSSEQLPFKVGQAHHTARAAADVAADAVTDKQMRLIDSDMIKELWGTKGGKAGIISLGAFVGLGLLHRLTRNPTPEDMGGPPLLPAGSPYEEYDPAPYSDVSSMYPTYAGGSSAGMRYTITTSNGYDPYRLGNDLSTLTGASSYRVNVHTSRSVSPRRSNQTSYDMIRDL